MLEHAPHELMRIERHDTTANKIKQTGSAVCAWVCAGALCVAGWRIRARAARRGPRAGAAPMAQAGVRRIYVIQYEYGLTVDLDERNICRYTPLAHNGYGAIFTACACHGE